MTDKGVGAEDRLIWQRWRALGEESRVAEPDALLLAAYAEGRLSEADAEAVEAWLAATPDVLGDLIAARANDRPRPVSESILADASALVAGAATPAGAEILPFRPRPPQLLPQWRTALAWSSIAASLLCASLIGFSMGSDAYASLSGPQAADTAEGLGAPGLDNSYFSDDSGT
jgi:anti-sigma factor RsiW